MATLGTFVAGQVLTAAELNAIGTWTTFTPVWTNVTVGNGTVTARYSQINDFVFVQVKLVLGSTSSITGQILMNHPVGTAEGDFQESNVRILDSGTQAYNGVVQIRAAEARLFVFGATLTYSHTVATSGTVPMTWTTSDSTEFQYWYKLV